MPTCTLNLAEHMGLGRRQNQVTAPTPSPISHFVTSASALASLLELCLDTLVLAVSHTNLMSLSYTPRLSDRRQRVDVDQELRAA